MQNRGAQKWKKISLKTSLGAERGGPRRSHSPFWIYPVRHKHFS